MEYAYPVLTHYGFKGKVFPVSAFLDRENSWDVHFGINRIRHLSVDNLRELYKAGWEVGSHGHTHSSLSALKNSEIEIELATSKKILEDIIQDTVKAFTPPFGKFNHLHVKLLENSGFEEIYIQKRIKEKKVLPASMSIHYYRSIYSIDSINNLQNKLDNNSYEIWKENVIHSCANATIVVKEIL